MEPLRSAHRQHRHPLTDDGEAAARLLAPVLADRDFSLVLCSPLQRARRTCELAGLGGQASIDPDLAEWNYGSYEGLTPAAIREQHPGWLVFRDGCPDGESPAEVGNGWTASSVGFGRTAAGWHCSPMATCSGCLWPAGSSYRPAMEPISCSIPPPSQSFPITGVSRQ